MDNSAGLDPQLTRSTTDRAQPPSDGYYAPFVRFQPYHFTARQLAHLLQLRSELLDARLGHGRWTQDLAASH